MISFILGTDSVTVFVSGKPYTINRQAKTFDAVMDAIRSNDILKLDEIVNIRSTIVKKMNKFGSDKVRAENGRLYYEDREVTGLISTRVFEMLSKGISVTPMVKFIENMMQNPSMRAVKELFGFMEACKLPVTEDGYFLAYKRVRYDYTSVHDRKTDNSIGRVVEMPRNMVDENAEQTCSYGLHFCSYDYLSHFSGERIVILKINPADVVAIPTDYNNSKGRACKYEVVGEIPLNEYKLPVQQLDENYTQDFGDIVHYDEDEPADLSEVGLDDPLSSSGMTLRKLRAIRDTLANGQTYASIAAEFDISPRQVGRIDRGEAWQNVK